MGRKRSERLALESKAIWEVYGDPRTLSGKWKPEDGTIEKIYKALKDEISEERNARFRTEYPEVFYSHILQGFFPWMKTIELTYEDDYAKERT